MIDASNTNQGVSNYFNIWLHTQLDRFNLDSQVYTVYIVEILKDSESRDEAKLDVEGVISSLLEHENDVLTLTDIIINTWFEQEDINEKVDETVGTKQIKSSIDIDKLLHDQLTLQTNKNNAIFKEKRAVGHHVRNVPHSLGDESESVKRAVLSLYDMSDRRSSNNGDINDCDFTEIEENDNAEKVNNGDVEEREKSRVLHAQKREANKAHREKQLQEITDKKKKAQAKTAKVERRR